MTRRWSLRTRFVLFATACLIPLIVVVLFFLDRSIERNTQQLINSEITIANLVNRSLTSYLQANVDALAYLARVDSVVELNQESVGNLLGLAGETRPELSGIFLVNGANREIVSSVGTNPETVQQSPSVSNQLTQTLENGQVTVSQLVPLEDGVNAIIIMVPVTTESEIQPAAATGSTDTTQNAAEPNTEAPADTATSQESPPGSTVGALGAVIRTDNLAAQVIPFASGDTQIAVASENEVIVSTSGIRGNEPTFLERQGDQIVQGIEGETGNYVTEGVDDTERLAVYAPIQFDSTNWATVVSNPTPRSYAQSLWLQGLLVMALAAIVILALAVIFGELTARPLRTLAGKALAIRRGDFNVHIEPMGGSEVRTLSTALSEMSHQLGEQMHGLEESRHDRERQTHQMRDLLRRTLRLQEDERRRIAGEIHDAVSPLITGALYQARALQMTNGSTRDSEREESLSSVNNLLERASEELHGVIFDLRPPDLDDIGVVAAIEAYVQTIQRTGLSCRLEVVDEPPPLTPEVRLGLYRIVQEALHNVVRHASADEAVVRLESTDDVVRVTIRDNGAGFDPESAVRPTSLGLLSMRERAAAIGASFTIVSRPGGGTAIVIERADTGNVMSDDVLADLIGAGHPHDNELDIESLPDGEFYPSADGHGHWDEAAAETINTGRSASMPDTKQDT